MRVLIETALGQQPVIVDDDDFVAELKARYIRECSGWAVRGPCTPVLTVPGPRALPTFSALNPDPTVL